jgi:HSP20 family protein
MNNSNDPNQPKPAASRKALADVYESEHAYTLIVDLPGVTKDDVDVSLKEGSLQIRASRSETDGSLVHYTRLFELPKTVEFDTVSAALAAGVLTLTLPKREVTKPRQIEVRAA